MNQYVPVIVEIDGISVAISTEGAPLSPIF